MSATLRAVFAYVAGSARAVSAVDLRECSNLGIADPRKRLRQLVARGCIRVAYTQARETFYRPVEGAEPPVDHRTRNGQSAETMRAIQQSRRWPRRRAHRPAIA